MTKTIPKITRSTRGTHDRFDVLVSIDEGETWKLCNVATDAPMSIALIESSDGTAQYTDGAGRTNMYRFPIQ